MDKETFEEKIKELGAMETPEEMRAGLAELQEAVSSVYDDNANM